jgi:hypothetical protein
LEVNKSWRREVIILRLAVVSALIYVGFAFAIEVTLLSLARMRGGVIFGMSKPLWFVFFGVFWFISFYIAFRISPLFNLARY